MTKKGVDIILKNLCIYTETGMIQDGDLIIQDGKILTFGKGTASDVKVDKQTKIRNFSAKERVMPGFIDLHIHGSNDADVMDGTVNSLHKMAEALPMEGTTSFLATTMTEKEEKIEKALKAVSTFKQEEGQAELLGVHLEGPFINSKRAGAQPLDQIKQPDITLFKKWQKLSGDTIKLVTLAPEVEGETPFIHYLQSQQIIPSMGHSDAVYEEVVKGIKAGVCHVTHLYNGMRGIHHRDPGVAGTALMQKNIMVEMIVDGVHIHPEMVKFTYQYKGADGILLITDSMRAKWMKDGISSLGGQKVVVKEGKALLENGTLAGSILKMNDAIKNMIQFSDCSIEEAIRMASYNPAKQLGILDRKGTITIGKEADLVVLNEEMEVLLTIGNGKILYEAKERNE